MVRHANGYRHVSTIEYHVSDSCSYISMPKLRLPLPYLPHPGLPLGSGGAVTAAHVHGQRELMALAPPLPDRLQQHYRCLRHSRQIHGANTPAAFIAHRLSSTALASSATAASPHYHSTHHHRQARNSLYHPFRPADIHKIPFNPEPGP